MTVQTKAWNRDLPSDISVLQQKTLSLICKSDFSIPMYRKKQSMQGLELTGFQTSTMGV